VGITRSVQYALTRFGINETPDKLTHFIGPPLHRSFMTSYAFDEPKARQAVEHYREYFAETGILENVLIPGVPDLLGALKTASRTLCVVTSKPAFYAEQIVRHFELDGFFDAVVGSEMDLSNADKALLIRLAMERYPDTPRAETVMVGDREHDVIGAKANDIDSIGVTFGAGSLRELEVASPTRIVATVEELGSALGL
jgi:phosphoglycolate phosphatase